MKFSKFHVVTGICVVIGLGTGLYFLSAHKNHQPVEQAPSRKQVLRSLQELKFVKNDLSNSDKERYFDVFKTQREALQQAIAIIEQQGEQASPGLYWPVLNLGNVHRDVGDYPKAEAAYLLAHELQPQAFPPLGNLGELYFRYLNNLPKAEQYYLMAIAIPSDYVEYYYNELYELYRFRLKDEVRAEQLLISGIAQYPDKLNLLAYLGDYYRQTNQPEKAIEIYQRLLKKNPKSEVAAQALQELQSP